MKGGNHTIKAYKVALLQKKTYSIIDTLDLIQYIEVNFQYLRK